MYSVDITNQSDYLFKVNAKGYEFFVDLKGEGATPPDTLLASLGTCLGVYVRKYADGAGIALGAFSVHVEAEFAKDPVCFKTIHATIDLKGFALDERRHKAMLAFIHNCPVHNTLLANPDVRIAIT